MSSVVCRVSFAPFRLFVCDSALLQSLMIQRSIYLCRFTADEDIPFAIHTAFTCFAKLKNTLFGSVLMNSGQINESQDLHT